MVASFVVSGLDDAAHWFLSRNRFEEYGFLKLLLTSRGLTDALPQLLPVDEEPAAEFGESGPLLLDGRLAAALEWGGYGSDFPGSAAEAKRLGQEVSGELIGDRYEDFRLDRSGAAWSGWFGAVVWDCTWVLADERAGRATLLCITDTD